MAQAESPLSCQELPIAVGPGVREAACAGGDAAPCVAAGAASSEEPRLPAKGPGCVLEIETGEAEKGSRTHCADTWGRPGHLTAVQAARLAELLALVRKEGEEEERDEQEALRWLRARAFSVPKALALRASVQQWWREERPHLAATRSQLVTHLLERQLLTWTPVLDRQNRAVMAVDCSRHEARRREGALPAFFACLDGAVAASPGGSLTCIFDCRCFGTANNDFRTAVGMVKALQNGYPERLGGAVILGAPRLFAALWRIISVLLDARTSSKVRFVLTQEELPGVVGAWAVPPALGGQDDGLQAHMRAFVDAHPE